MDKLKKTANSSVDFYTPVDRKKTTSLSGGIYSIPDKSIKTKTSLGDVYSEFDRSEKKSNLTHLVKRENSTENHNLVLNEKSEESKGAFSGN